jgi:hypothetical protein
MSSGAICKSCGHSIDPAAKLCPYCSANPQTGEKLDTSALLQEIFRPKELTTGESVLQYARQRQGIVLAAGIAVLFLLLAGLHAFVTRRNDSVTSASPAVPLTEVADVSAAAANAPPVAMPELKFLYDGHPQVMRTYIVERGAVTPPEVLAEQAAAQAKAAAATPQPGTVARPAQAPAAAPQRPPAR